MSTPWSSYASDRIKPRNTQSQPKKHKQQPQSQIPKSRPLIALESLLHALQTSSSPLPDPKGGCFCQAKEHPLSTYTPACPTCGLVLCALNPPQHACPHCTHAPPHTHLVIKKVQAEIEGVLREEERERERARAAVGAFPALMGGGKSPTPPPQQQHKVLSLNPRTKKVKVRSYTNTPVPSRPETPEALRVPPPPREVVHAKREVDPSRPFANLVGGAARYVPDKIKGKGKEKGKEKEAGPS